MKFLILILMALVIVSCSEKSWTKEEQNGFIQVVEKREDQKIIANVIWRML